MSKKDNKKIDFSTATSIGELYLLIGLYKTIDLDEFIEKYARNIDTLSDLIKNISESNGKFNLFGGITGGGSLVHNDLSSRIFNTTLGFLRRPEGSFLDTYCTVCEKECTFKYDDKYVIGNEFKIKNNSNKHDNFDDVFCISYVCTRCDKRRLIFLFERTESTFKKIAQYPSQMDLISSEVKEYQKELGGEYAREFHTAIGLHANGVGVGAFIYLRRIFEKLIYDTYRISGIGIDEKEFKKDISMDKKINLLSDFLPEGLIKNQNLYRILSIGIHELTDEECKEYFDPLKNCIEDILDEQIHKKKADLRSKVTYEGIQEINRKLQSK